MNTQSNTIHELHNEDEEINCENSSQNKIKASEEQVSSDAQTFNSQSHITPAIDKAEPKTSLNAYRKSFYRAENEDDDGYDPYSDRPSYTPFFEEDPWR